ncbi:MAG: serine hydrolase [Candidatus Thermoplasmatota archaeon]|nr:serine hydrolase [Candidatus Thermoplasmatota archaeon]
MEISERASAALEAFIRRKMEFGSIPGLAIGITDRERSIGYSYHGFSNIDAQIPPDSETLFEIGSMSKSFASVVALQLVDEGLLDVHRPVDEYLPWLEANWKEEKFTMHHLMSHTAGLPTGTEATPEPMSEVWTLRESELGCRPGEFFHYSNMGYKIVGLVIEKITGQSCAEAIAQRILKPLGMKSSYAAITHDMRGLLAVPYEPSPDDRPIRRGTRMVPAPWVESESADGPVSSNPEDMTAYIRMLLNSGRHPGGRLLSDEGFAALTKPVIRPSDSPPNEYYAYGLGIENADGRRVIAHTGGMVGYVSAMRMDFDAGIGAIVLTNGATDVDDVARYALTMIGRSASGPWDQPEEMPHSVSAADAAEYVGTYRSGSDSLEVFTDGHGMLFMASHGGSAMLESWGKDAFVVGLPGFEIFHVRFGREEGRVSEVFYGSEVYVRTQRGETELVISPKEYDAYCGHYRSSNPWLTNLRVLVRKGALWMVQPSGEEQQLVRLEQNLFRIGVDERSPDRILFEAMIEGKAQRAVLSGQAYARTRAP